MLSHRSHIGRKFQKGGSSQQGNQARYRLKIVPWISQKILSKPGENIFSGEAGVEGRLQRL